MLISPCKTNADAFRFTGNRMKAAGVYNTHVQRMFSVSDPLGMDVEWWPLERSGRNRE
jgi:hypothetical protein